MLPEVMEAVTGRRSRSRPAVLKGYARYGFRRRVYPGLVREDGERVEGVLYLAVDDRSLMLLDEFEGPYYRKETVRVDSKDGAAPCLTYLVADKFRALLNGEPWDVERFKTACLEAYLGECKS